MSHFRNTDVKKHLGRAAPRSVTPHAEEALLPKVGASVIPSSDSALTVPVAEATEAAHKTEAV